MNAAEIYQVEILICPNCQGQMVEPWDITEQLHNDIFGALAEFSDLYVVCPSCRLLLPVEVPECRIEYRRQIEHVDEGDGDLIELQMSAAPDMANAVSDWYRWLEGQIVDEDFTGIDAQFAKIMAG